MQTSFFRRTTFFAAMFAAAMLLAGAASAQTAWNIDPAHSAVQFSIRHMGISTVRGNFNKLSGTVQYDPADPGKTVIDATIDATSIDTRQDGRDKELRGASYFDVEKFPTLTFKSKRAMVGNGKLQIVGDLTIHGVTKEVTLDVDGPTEAKDQRGRSKLGATATTKINRKDFGVNGGGPVVADDVNITIDVELAPKPAAPAS